MIGLDNLQDSKGFSDNYAKIKIDSDDDCVLKKTLTIHNVFVLFKSVFNINQQHYCYNVFLEKFSSQLAKK